jgi:hypothetical protein
VATHTANRPADLPLAELKASFPQIAASVSVDNQTREGIGKLRQVMAAQAARLPLMGSLWPADWITGIEAIESHGSQYSTPEELYRVLASAGVADPAHQLFLLRALHALGDILHFDDDEELRDIVILRPQWVNKHIAKVLDSREVAERHGLLTRSHERQLWSDLDLGLRDRFLLLMEKFDLSYRILDDSSAASLVVERLSWDSPSYESEWGAALNQEGCREIRLVYRLDTLPPGVPTWFIAREHRFTTDTHWRTGALFRHSGDPRVLGLIRADRQEKTVELTVRGPAPQLFFSILQDGFESTLSRYEGLGRKRFVPCSCNNGDGTQQGRPCENLYLYEALHRRFVKSVPTIECVLSETSVNVADLLFAIAPAPTDAILGHISSQVSKLSGNMDMLRSEVAFGHREFLKALRRQQSRLEAVCPSLFTLTEATGRFHRPGFRRLQLRLYCEQPGEFHELPEEPYTIDQPTRWLSVTGPYLVTLVHVLKHAAPLAEPILGLTADHLAKSLSDEVGLMKELISQLPGDLDNIKTGLHDSNEQRRAAEDVDYRALYSLLRECDPNEHWQGLGRVYTPEGEILWLCSHHARQYGT